MRHASSSDVKNHFGEYLEIVRDEPVQVQRVGRPVAVLISWEAYESFQDMEDAYWGKLAAEAEKQPSVGHEEVIARIQKRLADLETGP